MPGTQQSSSKRTRESGDAAKPQPDATSPISPMEQQSEAAFLTMLETIKLAAVLECPVHKDCDSCGCDAAMATITPEMLTFEKHDTFANMWDATIIHEVDAWTYLGDAASGAACMFQAGKTPEQFAQHFLETNPNVDMMFIPAVTLKETVGQSGDRYFE
jgi:hypothetical protein